MRNVSLSLISAAGMMLVAAAAVIYWRRVSKLQFRWFWLGAGLWTVAVLLKIVCSLLTNPVIGFFQKNLAYPLYLLSGGLFLGIQSSFFEIGLTLLAVLIWRQLGRDADRAIGIGFGAGAFEAFLLGLAGLASIVTYLAGLPGAQQVKAGLDAAAAVTPLFWLVAPVERIIAVLCHASSRALVLLGTAKRKRALVLWGFLIFTLLDAVAGGAQISGKLGKISAWWIELALVPFALVSIPILGRCRRRWPEFGECL